MASHTGKKNGQSTKRPVLRYFFLNGFLHKKIAINRGRDLLVAWNYPEHRQVTYTYTDVLKRYKPAFTTAEVGEMIGRSKHRINDDIEAGNVPQPQYTYGKSKPLHAYMWSEPDIMGLLDYYSTVHRGRPRRDGRVTPQHLPTPRELRAMINGENILYVKQGDTFVPSWRAKEFK